MFFQKRVFMGNNEVDNRNIVDDISHYLEIYKLHADIITQTSNRRVNVNRYYVLALSVIVLALSAILRGGDILSDFFAGSNGSDNSNIDIHIIGYIVCITSILGMFLSASWIVNVYGYLRTNSNRYNIINVIENILSHKLDDISQNCNGSIVSYPKEYFSLAFHESYAPVIFTIGFTFLAMAGSILFIDGKWVLVIPIIPIIFGILMYIFLYYLKEKGAIKC